MEAIEPAAKKARVDSEKKQADLASAFGFDDDDEDEKTFTLKMVIVIRKFFLCVKK